MGVPKLSVIPPADFRIGVAVGSCSFAKTALSPAPGVSVMELIWTSYSPELAGFSVFVQLGVPTVPKKDIEVTTLLAGFLSFAVFAFLDDAAGFAFEFDKAAACVGTTFFADFLDIEGALNGVLGEATNVISLRTRELKLFPDAQQNHTPCRGI